ncbi:hypothetical protein EPIR_2743 [Erwinia piriflorinigrans CFBP 5888]|uniref:Uncharacterized protein n=1 Tax=Erwinia piriflorinigrans CFBP 5888 TaxID=1161919 RepID=V5ZB19_9GAMM|nr:hypothetical protein EPIR_2743 [Erwinia piriflorinigrans CFBP 5888]
MAGDEGALTKKWLSEKQDGLHAVGTIFTLCRSKKTILSVSRYREY